MYDPLVKQYEETFEIEGKKEKARKCFYRRMKLYKIQKEIFGKKRAQKPQKYK